jgi:hypothetical protein
MLKNNKIKLVLATFLLFIICILSMAQEHDNDYIEEPEAGGWDLLDTQGKMGSGDTTYVFDTEEEVTIEVMKEDGTYEEATRKPEDYEQYLKEAVDLWNEAAAEYYGEENYEIINMEEVEDGAMGIIKLEDKKQKTRFANVTSHSDPDDPDKKIDEWVMLINPWNFEKLNHESKVLVIAHEIGHIYGLDEKTILSHVQIMYRWFNIDNQGNIVPGRVIARNDFIGMEAVTGNFTCGEWTPVGTENECMERECTTLSGGSFTKIDPTHTCSDSQ